MQKKVINSLAEVVQGYCGYPFTTLTNKSLTNFGKISYFALFAALNCYKIQLHTDPIQDIPMITHGLEKYVKKIIAPHNPYIKIAINYPKVLLGLAGAAYFYFDTTQYKYVYCAGSLLFAYNAYTNSNFDKSHISNILKALIKNLIFKNIPKKT